jgi:hypothetical protein
VPRKDRRQRAVTARNDLRARVAAGYRELAAAEARRAELVAVIVASADRRQRAAPAGDLGVGAALAAALRQIETTDHLALHRHAARTAAPGTSGLARRRLPDRGEGRLP